jgi:hypothetical protein
VLWVRRLTVVEKAEVITRWDHLHRARGHHGGNGVEQPQSARPLPLRGGKKHLMWTPPPIAGEDEGGGDFLRNERPSRPGLRSTEGNAGDPQGPRPQAGGD